MELVRRSSCRVMLVIVAVALGAGLASSGFVYAQVIEFDLPDEIRVDTSRLIVTFVDTVRVDEAVVIIEDLGGRVAAKSFPPVVVWGLAAEVPQADALLALQADPLVIRLEVRPPSAAGGAWVTGDDGAHLTADFSTHAIRAIFSPWSDQDAATSAVRARLPGVPLRVQKLPNELTIDLPEGLEADAVVEALEANPLVQYVTFFSLDEPQIEE